MSEYALSTCARCGVSSPVAARRCSACAARLQPFRWGKWLGCSLLGLLAIVAGLWVSVEASRQSKEVRFFQSFRMGDLVEYEVTAVRGTDDGFFVVEYVVTNRSDVPMEPIAAWFSMRSAGGTSLLWDPLCSARPEFSRRSVHARDLPPGERIQSATCFFREGEAAGRERDDYLVTIDQRYGPPHIFGQRRALVGASF